MSAFDSMQYLFNVKMCYKVYLNINISGILVKIF
jgi:hypothetical protein